jgi:hypothetical protein
MRYFEAALNAILVEDDKNLLPEKQKRSIETAKKLGVEKLDSDEQEEVEHEYYAEKT